jgi:hypothetical protein
MNRILLRLVAIILVPCLAFGQLRAQDSELRDISEFRALSPELGVFASQALAAGVELMGHPLARSSEELHREAGNAVLDRSVADDGRHQIVDPSTGLVMDSGRAQHGLVAMLRAGHQVEITHVDENLGEGTLIKMAKGADDRVEAVFGKKTIVLSLKLGFKFLQLGHRTPESGDRLLKGFRERNPKRPRLDQEIVRRLYVVREKLAPEDLIWLTEELAQGHVPTLKALEWFFYLVYQRQRPWTGMTEATRDQVTANIEKARERIPQEIRETMRIGLLFAVWTPFTDSEMRRHLPADIPRRWCKASLPEKLFWIRKASSQIRAQAHKEFAARLEIADALGFQDKGKTLNKFMEKTCPLPEMALGVVSLRTSATIIQTVSWMAKDSPDDILFVEDAAHVLGRTAESLRSWVKNKYPETLKSNHQTPSVYLLDKFQLLPEDIWVNVLVEPDLSKPPSPFERKVIRTFIRALAGKRPLTQLRPKHLLKNFTYRGHTISLSWFQMHTASKLSEKRGWTIIHFILDRYGLLQGDAEKPPVASVADINSLDELKQAQRSGAIKRGIPWEQLKLDTKPEFLLAVLETIGKAVGKPGRGILWLTEQKDFMTPLRILGNKSPHRLYYWAHKKWKSDVDPDKPRSVVFYLAYLAGMELRWKDVQTALEKGWAHNVQLKAVPEHLRMAA